MLLEHFDKAIDDRFAEVHAVQYGDRSQHTILQTLEFERIYSNHELGNTGSHRFHANVHKLNGVRRCFIDVMRIALRDKSLSVILLRANRMAKNYYLHRNQRRITLMSKLNVVVGRFDDPILRGRHKVNGTRLHCDLIISVRIQLIL